MSHWSHKHTGLGPPSMSAQASGGKFLLGVNAQEQGALLHPGCRSELTPAGGVNSTSSVHLGERLGDNRVTSKCVGCF